MDHTATAEISTAKASGYLQQICKHFSHKIEVEFDTHKGTIAFPFGHAELAAEQDVLTLNAFAGNEDDLEKLKQVLSSHLERFAFRESLEITWN
ncbi:MAG: DUF2218 domain-containing protein [Paracoccaceae bacterium]|nr:DUF2218 domain-containing protein [Paracoccaceae bacterium]MDG1739366.1 DUF2218 domain-containing protein [Paracoccaceae bacterium]MDG2258773.1 DUF2218 domain-containing protein [Paracoccaceae bacterium]